MRLSNRMITLDRVWSVIKAVEVNAVLRELGLNSPMSFIEILERDETASDSRLIGNDDELKTFVPQQAQCFENIWQIFDLIGIVEIDLVDNQRAVAIEKYRFLHTAMAVTLRLAWVKSRARVFAARTFRRHVDDAPQVSAPDRRVQRACIDSSLVESRDRAMLVEHAD